MEKKKGASYRKLLIGIFQQDEEEEGSFLEEEEEGSFL